MQRFNIYLTTIYNSLQVSTDMKTRKSKRDQQDGLAPGRHIRFKPDQDKEMADLARDLGVSFAVVARIAAKYGMPDAKRDLNPEKTAA